MRELTKALNQAWFQEKDTLAPCESKMNHCKIQIPRFCQQKEEYCSSFPTKVAETLTWIPIFSWHVDTLQKQQSELNIKLF